MSGIPPREGDAPRDDTRSVAGSAAPAALRALADVVLADASFEGDNDPLAPARARAPRVRHALLDAYPVITVDEAAARLGIRVVELEAAVVSGRLIALYAGGVLWIPELQIAASRILPGLTRLLDELVARGVRTAWSQWHWITAPDAGEYGESALELLRRGDANAALAIARLYGEQGA